MFLKKKKADEEQVQNTESIENSETFSPAAS